MSKRFNSQQEAKDWLKLSKGNKLERSQLDENQRWSLIQAKNAVMQITGEYENFELDNNEEASILHEDRQNLILFIYSLMQKTEYHPGYTSWSKCIGKRHGYSTKNFVLGAIDYFCEKNNY